MLVDIKYLESELQLINRNPILPSMSLQDPREETLRIEESTEPIGRGITISDPGIHEQDPLLKISSPTG